MASADGLRQRRVDSVLQDDEKKTGAAHPAGPVKHSGQMQAWRMFLFALYFTVGIFCIFITQLVGLPLYFYNRDYFYAYMAVTKQHFGLLITTMTQWWSPTTVRICGDESVRSQLRQTEDGRLECDFDDRLVLIANHQIYTDWIYLWWIAYTKRMHGHIYIILKESLKYIPIIGTGMMCFGFIFLSRRWAKDKPRFQYRLSKLNSRHSGPMAGEAGALDPMWLLLYPEGTNLSHNGRVSSKKWADKNSFADFRHVLLPRSTGLLFCLQELKSTVEYVYDCTVGYEGIPRGEYGQDIFTLRSTYFQGRRPKSVNFHFRRFHISTIPVDDPAAFELWLRDRWQEKDDLLEHFVQTGRFPADDTLQVENGMVNGKVAKVKKGAGWIETEVRPKGPLEILQLAAPAVLVFVVVKRVLGAWRWLMGTGA